MREINFLKLPSVSENRQKEYNQIFSFFFFFCRGKRTTVNGTNWDVSDGKALHFPSQTILHNNSIFILPLTSIQSLFTSKRSDDCTGKAF